MKTSARNVLAGKVEEITKGASASHTRLAVGDRVFTAAITNEAVEEPGLAKGRPAHALIEGFNFLVTLD